MSYALGYDPCFKCDKKMCSMCELTYYRNKQLIEGVDMKKCIDCIHAEACKEMLEAMGYKVSEEYEGNAERCDTFKHKSDVVEVVRCKDCKYLKYGYQCYCPLGMNLTNNEDAYVLVDADNDFCSYGERKDEGK